MKTSLWPAPTIVLVLSQAIVPAFAETAAVGLSGIVEIEAGQSTDYADNSTSDIVLATFELGIDAQIDEELSASVVLLHEEDDTDFEVDAATLTYAPKNSNWSVTAGQTYLPFGRFESHMISDPLTLEMAEIRETAMQLDINAGAMMTSVYLFNGDDKTNKTANDAIDNFGFRLSYQYEGDMNVSAGFSYINDMANIDLIQDSIAVSATDEYVAAYGIDLLVEAGDINFIFEHIMASDSFEAAELAFNGQAAEPASTNIEVGYLLTVAGKPAVIALAQQMTSEAFSLGLPESRTSIAFSYEIKDNTVLAFELANNSDYAVADGGTGESASAITAQLAVEF